ncbi:MAG TPA: DUF1905 domain-containing protein [Arcobacter sp.]|jgi:hypothetical protein|nr:DUF1905 domain-containing protein [Arcobacter sp.]
MKESYQFKSTLTKLANWFVAPLPDDIQIEAVHAFGRTPVIATVNNKTLATSIWREKNGKTMIAIPKKVRGKLLEGDEVEIYFKFDYDRF